MSEDDRSPHSRELPAGQADADEHPMLLFSMRSLQALDDQRPEDDVADRPSLTLVMPDESEAEDDESAEDEPGAERCDAGFRVHEQSNDELDSDELESTDDDTAGSEQASCAASSVIAFSGGDLKAWRCLPEPDLWSGLADEKPAVRCEAPSASTSAPPARLTTVDSPKVAEVRLAVPDPSCAPGNEHPTVDVVDSHAGATASIDFNLLDQPPAHTLQAPPAPEPAPSRTIHQSESTAAPPSIGAGVRIIPPAAEASARRSRSLDRLATFRWGVLWITAGATAACGIVAILLLKTVFA